MAYDRNVVNCVRWNELHREIEQSWLDALISERRKYSTKRRKSAIIAPIAFDECVTVFVFDCDGLGRSDRRVFIESHVNIIELYTEFKFDEVFALSVDCYIVAVEAASRLPEILVRRIIRQGDCQGRNNHGTALETQIAMELLGKNGIKNPTLLIFELIGSDLLFGMNNFDPVVKSNRSYEEFVQMVIPQLNQTRKLNSIVFVQQRLADQFLAERRLSQFWPIMSMIANPYRAVVREWDSKKHIADMMVRRVNETDKKSFFGKLFRY